MEQTKNSVDQGAMCDLHLAEFSVNDAFSLAKFKFYELML